MATVPGEKAAMIGIVTHGSAPVQGFALSVTVLCHRNDTNWGKDAKICKGNWLRLACGAGLIDVSVCRNYALKRVKVYLISNFPQNLPFKNLYVST